MRIETRGPIGRTVKKTAPTGGYTGGAIVILGAGTTGWCGLAAQDYDAGETAVIRVGEEAKVTKVTGTGKSFAIGDKVYRDASSGNATPTATGNAYVGRATSTATTAATSVWAQFAPTGG